MEAPRPKAVPMRTLLLPLALLCAALPVQAQEGPPRWTFGVIAADRDAPYTGLDEDLLVVPLVRFEGERFYLRGLRAGWRLVDTPGYELAVIGQARFDGYDAEDSPFLAGMSDRRASLDLGLASTWTSKKLGALELSGVVDALDRSGGAELAASWNLLFRAGGWTVVPGASLRWQSEDMVDYYYGVRAIEGIVGRPPYYGEAALTPDVSVLATLPFAKRWTFFVRASHAWLPSEISDSPIVDDESSTALFVGLGYSPD
ncbi:MipA/OmpV family protein [Arenimonas terrae]|uniref:MipA/OmpV family protein n=2 Tax=Arenimonas terrae TaxID=2546226 RepID=A0A5C4RSA7_9GAMM|nr:MipA/OmpV family protein [Arenimonas terrae]